MLKTLAIWSHLKRSRARRGCRDSGIWMNRPGVGQADNARYESSPTTAKALTGRTTLEGVTLPLYSAWVVALGP
jgi:hypothetical protein